MWFRYLVLAVVAMSLLAANPTFRAQVRQGEGGFLKGLIREKLGELGAAGKWLQASLQAQWLDKRVHYIRGEYSWGGKVIAVEVQPYTEHTDDPREVKITVETMAGMGDQINEKEQPSEEDFGSEAVITLDQISGAMIANPVVGSSIEVTIPDDVAFPAVMPSSPAEMFYRGYPNIIVAYYNDGYYEVEVKQPETGLPNPSPHTTGGTIFIHATHILHDPQLKIVGSSRDLLLENTLLENTLLENTGE